MLNRTILNDDEPEKSDGKDKDKDKEKFPVIGERLFKARTILIYGGIDQKLAERISAQLLALQAAGDEPITIFIRSEERRVGKECVSTCRSRWSPSHSKKKELRDIKTPLADRDRQQHKTT